jgi:hypothetical protein
MTPNKIYRPEVERPLDIEVVKWLRQHGERGTDYNFAGSGRTLSVWFMNDRIEVLYLLRWE